MNDDFITFELAAHFLPKVALSIENHLQTIQAAILETHPLTHIQALLSLIELLKIVEKPELKSRFLKEMHRFEHVLAKDLNEGNKAPYAKLYLQIHQLGQHAGRFAQSLFTDSFIQNIWQSLPQQQSELILLPEIKYWVSLDAAPRQSQLTEWLFELKLLQETVETYLSLLRIQAKYENITLDARYYQQTITSKLPCHLISLTLNQNHGLIPKIQIGQHGVSVRFVETFVVPHEATKEINFHLGLTYI